MSGRRASFPRLAGRPAIEYPLRIPQDCTAEWTIHLGREAGPGEVYHSRGSATGAGEMLSGFRVDEQPVPNNPIYGCPKNG
ncbi:hypothetical protein ACIBQX_26620 [Nonomuraea sp. NPDC049714]|uniref:hypothetical protein n=1 Tax=Nonomuraea sp. NPDC049714 TaxID=3364357 RepID=UPI00379B0366